MKKLLASLLVLAMCAPAMAISFTTQDNGGGELQINYTLAAGEGLRGLALTLDVTDGDAFVNASTDYTAAAFNTFIDYAYTTGATYEVTQGHPFAQKTVAGVATFPASSFALSMGYLDQAAKQLAITSSGVITVKFTKGTTTTATVRVDLDPIRGGAVGDALVLTATNLPADQVLTFAAADCWTGDAASRAQWESVGKPDGWCKSINARQCKGDADGLPFGKNNYWVAGPDLDVLVAAWSKPYATIAGQTFNGIPLINADFDRLPFGKNNYRVAGPDLDILVANWSKTNAPAPVCQDVVGAQ